MTDQNTPEKPEGEVAFSAALPSLPKEPKKRWLSLLYNSKAGHAVRAYAAPAALGVGVGLAVKTCAFAMLCTAGAPAVVTAVTACAVSGFLAGLAREGWKFRKEQQQDANAKFWTKGRLKSAFISAAVAGVFGAAAIAFGDEIREAAEAAYDKVSSLFGSGSTPDIQPPLEEITPPPVPEPDTGPAAPPVEEILEAETPEDSEGPPAEELTEPPANEAPEAETPEVDTLPPIDDVLPEPEVDAETPQTEETAEPPIAPVEIVPETHIVKSGDNLWNIVKAHYGLTGNAEIQRFTDAVAQANGLTDGTAANTILIGDEIVLPPAAVLEGHDRLVLDWQALDAETRSRHNGPKITVAATASPAFT